MKALPGSYLILGRPRSRTAWLSAILFGAIPCYHDELHRILELISGNKPFGLAAPSLPMLPLEYADFFTECPIVVIGRPAEECFASLDRFLGFSTPGAQEMYESRFQALLERLPNGNMVGVAYSQLDEYETVDRIHRHCLGVPLDRERFHAFNLLRVEQHLPKVIDNTPAAIFGGRQRWLG